MLLQSPPQPSPLQHTITPIPNNLPYTQTQTFLTNTIINFILHNHTNPTIFPINKPHTNLLPISPTNTLTRDLAGGHITLKQPYHKLHPILNSPTFHHHFLSKFFPPPIISITFLYLQQPHLIDIFTTLIPPPVPYILLQFFTP
ncbi:threonine/serine exporter family protein, partial [Staphylococcus auricularis]|uniref:threonine/serine exporter family protein n=1 Tax=Staphylococcus auricularis TaxID=29379 RepID=UPI00384C3042